MAVLRRLLALGCLATADALVLRRQPNASNVDDLWITDEWGNSYVLPCGCPSQNLCTCKGTLDNANCMALQCHRGCSNPACSAATFFETCKEHARGCSDRLELNCGMDGATCTPKKHQTADGRFKIDFIKAKSITDKAFCGPTGKCLGKVSIKAALNNNWPDDGIMECVMPKNPAAIPAPGSKEACLSGCACDGVQHASLVGSTNYCCAGGAVAPHVVYGDPSTCSCASTYQDEWLYCSGPVREVPWELMFEVDYQYMANCSMPMPENLDVGVQLKGSCWLAKEAGGKRLTQHAQFVLENR